MYKMFFPLLIILTTLMNCSDSASSANDVEISSGQLGMSVTTQSSVVISSGTSATSLLEKYSSSSIVIASSVSGAYWNQAISYGVLTDTRDKKKYRTTQIGNQNWMAENLNFSATTGDSRCYDAKASNCSNYGRLYNWDAAVASCQEGWHLPHAADWDELAKLLKGASIAGKTLKAESELWSPNTGNDAFGFAALPSGYYSNDQYYDLATAGLWWTSSEVDSVAFYRDIVGSSNALRAGYEKKNVSLAVRCIQDVIIPGSYSVANSSSAVQISSSFVASSSPPSTSSTTVGTSSNSISSSVTVINTEICTYSTNSLVCPTISYPTVTIGGQTWMAKNLAWLPSVNANGDSSTTDVKYYVYGYDGTAIASAKTQINFATYGVLYNYQAALTACPAGWHLPSDDEWVKMEVSLGMTPTDATATGWRGTDQGTQLKANSTLWSKNSGTNTSGFSALPSGALRFGSFDLIGDRAYFWTGTADDASYAAIRVLYNDLNNVLRYSSSTGSGFSVRCIKDSN